jgi:dTMP kinase
MTTRGKFILFEGLDRSGKTTQATRLVAHLTKSGTPAVLMKFPNRETPIGKLINSYLANETTVNDRLIHLMFTMNRWEEMTAFHQHIHAGVNVVMDRFSYSGIAYSTAKNTLSFEWCMQTEEGLPKPDIVLFMDMPSTSMRQGWGEERYEQSEFQQKVRNVFDWIQDLEPTRWFNVDADESRDNVEDQIRYTVTPRLTMEMGPLQYME